MPSYFKALTTDGHDFVSDVAWFISMGSTTRRPRCGPGSNEDLVVADDPTLCWGAQWPCRLVEVEPVEDVYPTGRCGRFSGAVFRVVGEHEPYAVFGPQGKQVAHLLVRLLSLPISARRHLSVVAQNFDQHSLIVLREAIVVAGLVDPCFVIDDATDLAVGMRLAARTGSRALLARHVIQEDLYRTLATPLMSVVGSLHPDD